MTNKEKDFEIQLKPSGKSNPDYKPKGFGYENAQANLHYSSGKSPQDWMGVKRNAQELVSRIEKYWHSRGYVKFKTQIQKRSWITRGDRMITHYDIRSNLVDGIPPK